MRSFAAILCFIFSAHLTFADGQVLKGKFVSASSPIIGHTSLKSDFCPNKPGEKWYCDAIVFEGVTLTNSEGQEVKLDHLVIPAKTSGGLMGMAPSGDVIFIALAITPHDQLPDEYKEFIKSARLGEISYVLVDGNQATTHFHSKVALAQVPLHVELTDQGREANLKEIKEQQKEPSENDKRGVIEQHFGGYLDLQKLAGDQK